AGGRVAAHTAVCRFHLEQARRELADILTGGVGDDEGVTAAATALREDEHLQCEEADDQEWTEQRRDDEGACLHHLGELALDDDECSRHGRAPPPALPVAARLSQRAPGRSPREMARCARSGGAAHPGSR